MQVQVPRTTRPSDDDCQMYVVSWSVCVCMYEDIDECLGNGGLGVCGSAEEAVGCQNADGNFNCDCKPGYRFDQTTCAGWFS